MPGGFCARKALKIWHIYSDDIKLTNSKRTSQIWPLCLGNETDRGVIYPPDNTITALQSYNKHSRFSIRV